MAHIRDTFRQVFSVRDTAESETFLLCIPDREE